MRSWVSEHAKTVAAAAATVVVLFVGILIGRGWSADHGSAYLSPTGDFSGTLERLSSDGDAAVLRTDDGKQVDVALLTPRPELKPGTHILGTFVDLSRSGDISPYFVIVSPIPQG